MPASIIDMVVAYWIFCIFLIVSILINCNSTVRKRSSSLLSIQLVICIRIDLRVIFYSMGYNPLSSSPIFCCCCSNCPNLAMGTSFKAHFYSFYCELPGHVFVQFFIGFLFTFSQVSGVLYTLGRVTFCSTCCKYFTSCLWGFFPWNLKKFCVKIFSFSFIISGFLSHSSVFLYT